MSVIKKLNATKLAEQEKQLAAIYHTRKEIPNKNNMPKACCFFRYNIKIVSNSKRVHFEWTIGKQLSEETLQDTIDDLMKKLNEKEEWEATDFDWTHPDDF